MINLCGIEIDIYGPFKPQQSSGAFFKGLMVHDDGGLKLRSLGPGMARAPLIQNQRPMAYKLNAII